MEKGEMFQSLVRYHHDNLDECRPYMREGKVYIRGQPTREGFTENDLYRGFLVVANGTTLSDNLVRDRIVLDKPTGFVPVGSQDDFLDYITKQDNCDGAFIFDGQNSRISRVSELNNNPASLPDDFSVYSMLPADFLSESCNVDLRQIGTKTRLAVKIPHAYDETDTYQVKNTAFTPLGIGKVTHFNREGLKEEFFFRCDRGEIVGVYRRYGMDDGSIVLLSETEIRNKDEISRIAA